MFLRAISSTRIRFACKKLPECIYDPVLGYTKASPNYTQAGNKFAGMRNDVAPVMN